MSSTFINLSLSSESFLGSLLSREATRTEPCQFFIYFCSLPPLAYGPSIFEEQMGALKHY